MSEEAHATGSPAVLGEPAGPARPLKRRALVVSVLLVLGIVADLAALVAEVGQLGVLGDLDRGTDVSIDTIAASDDFVGNAAIAQVLTFVATAIAFIAWFYRAYRNLPALGAERRFGAGWSIGGWMVPFLNLVRPKQVADDIWRATEPGAPVGHAHSGRSVSPLLHVWWAAWLIGGIGDRVSARLYLNSESISSQQNASYVSIVTDVLFMIAAVLAVLVVRAMTRRYEDRRAELAS